MPYGNRRGFNRGGGGFRGGGGGFRRNFGGPREMHKATCAECGKECEVPFKPIEGRDVFCKECFMKKKGITPRSEKTEEESEEVEKPEESEEVEKPEESEEVEKPEESEESEEEF